MTLDTLRKLAEGELEDEEIDEAKSTVRRYLRDYDNRVDLGTHVTSKSLDANFSPTYRENMFEAFSLYLEAGKDDGLRDAILAMGDDNADSVNNYI